MVAATRLGDCARPADVWFIAAIIAQTGADYTAFVAWLRNPITDILMSLLLIALFYHTALGFQVVIEDYVHSGTKFAAVIAVRLACFASPSRVSSQRFVSAAGS